MATPTPAEAAAIAQRYDPLYTHFQTKESPAEPVLLAHYTSVQALEQILKSGEVWFSNPLYMNDLEEMRIGIAAASQLFPEFAQLAGGGSVDRTRRLIESFNHYVTHLATEAALDTYVFCMSEQKAGDTDGLLSMWREYGARGNGAALVINTQNLHYQLHHPITIAKVNYVTYAERLAELRARLTEWSTITINANLDDDHLYLAAFAAFFFAKWLALITKHSGFSEEREWRAVYVPERDPKGYLKPLLDYFVGSRGVEPKLKYKFGPTYKPLSGAAGDDLTTGTLSDILAFILLGPTVSSGLAKSAFIRMLERTGMSAFSDRVLTSTIPLRPEL